MREGSRTLVRIEGRMIDVCLEECDELMPISFPSAPYRVVSRQYLKAVPIFVRDLDI